MDGSASRWQSLLRDLEKETATLENLNPLVLWYSEADAFWHILEQTSRGEGLQKITKRSSIRSSQTIRKLCGRVASECFRRFPQELEQMNTTLRSLASCLKLPQTASVLKIKSKGKGGADLLQHVKEDTDCEHQIYLECTWHRIRVI